MPKRRLSRLLLPLLVLALLLPSCSNTHASPSTLLDAICQAEASLPSGRRYLLSAPENDPLHPSPELLASLWGNGSLPPAFDGVEDAAFFFSYTHPCELAVFLCKESDRAEEVATLCTARLSHLQRYYEQTENADGLAYIERATVRIRGRWVIFCISSDPAASLRAFRKAL